jgi:uncharacterized protein YegL
MKKGLSDIVFILDRSGSMMSIMDDTIGGYNSFLKKLREVPGEATVTLVQFDHEYEIVYSRVPLSEVPELTSETFVPRGQTALLDAIGRAIIDERAKIKTLKESEKPEKIIITILTDGHENHSKEFTQKKVMSYIMKLQEKDGWEFIFLGADPTSIEEAVSYGINLSNTMTFAPSGQGVRRGYDSLSNTINSYRTSPPIKKPDSKN